MAHLDPTLALWSASVAHAIYAVTALCIANDNLTATIPQPAEDSSSLGEERRAPRTQSSDMFDALLMEAETHHGRSLVLMQDDMATLSEENVESVLATSGLLVLFGLASNNMKRLHSRQCIVSAHLRPSSCTDSSAGSELGSSVASFDGADSLAWLWFIRGVKTMRLVAEQDNLLRLNSPLRTLHSNDSVISIPATQSAGTRGITDDTSSTSRIPPRTRIHVAYQHPTFPAIHATRLDAFHTLATQLKAMVQSTHVGDQARAWTEDCIDALAMLRSVVDPMCHTDPMMLMPGNSGCSAKGDKYFLSHLVTLYDRNPHRSIFTWPCRVSSTFVELLKHEYKPALAVYAHFLVFTIVLEEIWWIGDMGRSGLRDIFGCLDKRLVR